MKPFQVKEIWRYPVKSMQGERLQTCVLTAAGVPLDRGWAVLDHATKTLRGAKHIGALLNCSAHYIDGTSAGAVPHVIITLPDGSVTRSDQTDVHERLSQALGRAVTLCPLQPAEDADHYRVKGTETDSLENELRLIFGLLPDEPLPELSTFGPKLLQELSQYATPRGAYYDACPIHLLTEASIRRFQSLTPSSKLDVRRFRPNLLVSDSGGVGEFAENTWVGKRVTVGRSQLSVLLATMRCVMTTREQMELPHDSEIMRTLVRETDHCLGVYADVIASGEITVGAEVTAA